MEKNNGFHPLQSFCTAFSLYSHIPVPKGWVTEAGMRYALCFFPCVGIVTGLVMIVYERLAIAISLGKIAFCCVGTAIPLMVTGGIHMDGFLDTADALSSFAGPDKKREILKDPHTGAFAIIWGGIYLLLYLAAFSELSPSAFPAIAGIFIQSRALSGFSVTALKKAGGPGMVRSLSERSDTQAVNICMIFWMAASMVYFLLTAGFITMLAETAAAIICLAACYGMAKREFGGMSGDLAGFFLQICELLLIIILAVFH